jgi:glycosyltransferase involved in cell wall biosynthesis
MQRIAFFAFRGAFDHRQIGGVESIMRRLTASLAKTGHRISLVLYGCPESKEVEIGSGISQRCFTTFDQAIRVIETEFDHVVSVYLRPPDRIRYALFRKRHSDCIFFHHLYCVWHESRLKREMLFSVAKIVPFNGWIFTVSPRLHRHVSSWAKRCALLLPPVPSEYFCEPREKPTNGTVRITYAGRLDPAKGATEAVKILRALARRKDFEPQVLGYAWPHDAETLKMQDMLRADTDLQFDLADHKNWTEDGEKRFQMSLRHTDILLLPYRRLSSTVDTPLLLLEGMANLCAIITPALGDLHDIYGSSRFGLCGRWNVDHVIQAIMNAGPYLAEERRRLRERNAALQFSADNVATVFRNAIGIGN